MRSSHLRAYALRTLLLAAGLGSMAGCRDSSEILPTGSRTSSAAAASGQPFYYYFKEKVPLQVDPSRVVVRGAPGVAAAAREALRAAGVSVLAEEALPGDHWLLRVGGVAAGQLQAARAQLKRGDRGRFMSHVYRTLDGHDLMPMDRLLVQFKPGVSTSQITALVESMGLSVLRSPEPGKGLTWYLLRYPTDPATDPLSVAVALAEQPLVEWADPDNFSDRRPAYVPAEPLYSSQWYLKSTTLYNGVPVDINVEPAWDLTLGSSSIKVAVIDLGVDVNNPDVGSALVGGWDLYAGVFSGEDAYHPCLSSCVYDLNGTPYQYGDSHGTEVAGIIAARHNGLGVAGIAPNVQLLSVRAGRNKHMGTSQELSDAVTWAWNTGQADVINCSWNGGVASSALTTAINNASTSGRAGKGAVVVFSAGNGGGGVEYPATLTSVVAVGAISRTGALTSYSARGPETDVVAPSSADNSYIVTTDLVSYFGSGTGDYSLNFSGTSAAAPQVSGAAALMLSREPQLPSATVRERLRMQADPWGPNTGGGKLNVRRSLDMPPFTLSIVGPRYAPYQYASGSCTWTATTAGGQGPYTYVFKRDGYQVSNGPTYTLSGPLYTSSTTLEATVTDALGTVRTASWMVLATTSSTTCY
ncbi:MAG: S8 family serine peptidase [Longimicrobiaceae bacterium]